MGSLLYALWWWAHPDSPFAYDHVVFCTLVSLDAQTWLRVWLWHQARR